MPGTRARREQQLAWDRFYREHRRPWRGVARLGGLEVGRGERALDIGCGNGKTVAALQQAGAAVTGLDFSPAAVAACLRRCPEAEAVVAGCDRLPFGDGTFDVVTLVHVLEHLDEEQLRRTADEAVRVLADGGRILVRSFAVGDLRSDGGGVSVRGNGIRYRYLTEEEVTGLFGGLGVLRAGVSEEEMRFGGVRRRVECVFVKRPREEA